MHRTAEMTARQALLVLGMHRSGTSALSGVLARLGAQPPKTLMVPTKDNPKGYWESTELQQLHDRLLRKIGSRWNDWGAFDPGWESTAAYEFRVALAPILEHEFGDARLLLIKDPRICRFLPLWLRALGDMGVAPRILIPIRNPLEVARSLATRDGFGQDQSLLLWLRHVLDAEFSSRGCIRTFVRYSDLLTDWKAVTSRIAADLQIEWSCRSKEAELEIDRYLTRELRHHVVEETRLVACSAELSKWVERAFRVVDGYCGSRFEDSDVGRLDAIRGEFDRAAAIFVPAIREQDAWAERLHVEMKGKLAEKAREQEITSAQLREAERRLKTQEGVLMEQNKHAAEMALAQEHLEAMEVMRSSFAGRHGKLLSLLEEQLDLVQNEMKSLTAAHRVALETAALRFETAERERSALEAQLRQQQIQYSRSLAEHEAAEKEIEHQLGAAISGLASSLRKCEDRIAGLESLNASAETAALTVSSLEQQNEGLKQQLEERFREIVALTQMLEESDRARDKSEKSNAATRTEVAAMQKENRRLIELHSNCQLEKDMLAVRIQQLLNSRSWRVTSPLRVSMNLVRKLLR